MINEQPATLAERLVQLRTAVQSFAHSLTQEEADRLPQLLSYVGEIYYAAAEALAQDEELTHSSDAPRWLKIGDVLRVADPDCTACGGGGWTDESDDHCPFCMGEPTDVTTVYGEDSGVVTVYCCFYCLQSVTRDDPADAYHVYSMKGDPRGFACDPSPWGEHGVICGDCQGRALRACVSCDGKGATA